MLDAWDRAVGIGWGTQVYSGATGLPRSFDTFREGQFSAMEPIWPVPIDRGEEPSGRPRPRRFCYAADTEILTRRGWLTFDQVTCEDEVATRSEAGLFEWQHPRVVIWEPYAGEMVWFHSQSVDVLVTPNHGMLHRRRLRETHADGTRSELGHVEEVELAGDLAVMRSDVQLVASSKYVGGNTDDIVLHADKANGRVTETSRAVALVRDMLAAGVRDSVAIYAAAGHAGIARHIVKEARKALGIPILKRQAYGHGAIWGDPTKAHSQIGSGRQPLGFRCTAKDFAAFMGMWLAEGHLSAVQGEYRVAISQTPNGKGFEEFRALLIRILGHEPQYHRTAWVFRDKALFEFLRTCGDRAWNKRIPAEVLDLDQECLEEFWHYYWLGDGSHPSPTVETISTTSKAIADGLQEVLQKIGSWGVVWEDKLRTDATTYINGQAVTSRHSIYRITRRHRGVAQCQSEFVPYDGMIGCVNVPNGIVYVRRDDHPIWSSNTFPVGFNLPVGQPGTEGIMLCTFQVLRDYAEIPSIPRTLIELTKADIEDLAWDIIPTDDAQAAMQGNPKKRKDFEKRKAEVMEFWANPDPTNYDGFDEWLNAVLEDSVVLDAVALYLAPTVGKGHGPCGSDLAALEVLDGSMVKPLLDDWGARPQPPEPAYQLYQWGVPRIDLMDIINLGPDATITDLKALNPILDELSETVNEWSGDQLLYMRTNPRTWTPYGLSPLAEAMLPAAILMARQTWQWEYYRCHDDQTEVLTDAGWKLFAKLDETDQVATRSADGLFEWEHPVEYHDSWYDGDLLHFTNTGLDMMVTPNHRMMVRRTERGRRPESAPAEDWDWHYRTASEFVGRSVHHGLQFELPTGCEGWEVSVVPDAKPVEYHGQVYCVTVPNGNLLTRRNGKLAWSGNSGSLPQVFLDPGETIANAEEARQLQTAINLMGGDIGAKHQVIVIPPGAKVIPQKETDLSDQFDEWLTALLCMPFGYSISDLGITPKVAGLTSPQAAHGSASSAESRSTRHAIVPRVKKLKTKIFDRITQKVMGQKDMQWSWGILEQGENKSDQTTRSLSLFKGSVTTLDETRIANELDPIGIKGISDVPIVFTPTGAVLITSIGAPPAAPPSELGPGKPPPQAALPPGPPVKPPGGGSDGAPGPKPGDTTPLEEGAQAAEAHPVRESQERAQKSFRRPAVERELAVLRRYLRKNGSLDRFVPEVLRHSAIHAGSGVATGHYWVVKAAQDHQDRRDVDLSDVQDDLLSELAESVYAQRTRELSPSTALGRAKDALAQATRLSYQRGSVAALSDLSVESHEIPAAARIAGEDAARLRVTEQDQYLRDFLTNGATGTDSPAELAQRAAMWAHSMTAPYEQGYVTTSTEVSQARGKGIVYRWHLGTADHCSLCLARAGQTFTAATLPGMPGDGGFGPTATVCLGGVNCACWVSIETPDGSILNASQSPSLARQRSLTGNEPAWLGEKPDFSQALRERDLQVAAQEREDAAIRAKVPWRGPKESSLVGAGKSADQKDFSAGSPLASGFAPYTLAPGVGSIYPDPMVATIIPDKPTPRKKKRRRKSKGAASATEAATPRVIAAGLAVRAEDTGRVLLLQRAVTDDDTRGDPAGGTFEFAGGHVEDGELPFDAARREWSEEVGCPAPDGQIVGMWESANGIYQGFTMSVPSESDVDINLDYPRTENPDAPLHAKPETAAWMAIDDLAGMPSLRPELANDLERVLPQLRMPARALAGEPSG